MSQGNLSIQYTDDQEKVTATLERARVVLPWTELVSITVVMTSAGPFVDDCFIELAAADGKTIALPTVELEKSFLLDRLTQLPGFDHYLYLNALGVTAEDRLEVWMRKNLSDEDILQAVSDQNILPKQPEGMAIPNPHRFFHDLRAAYATPRRSYHNWTHITECLKEYWDVTSWHQPKEVWCAILLHDVIYIAGRKDNEARSADYAFEALAGIKVDRDRVKELILWTAFHQQMDRLAKLDEDARRFLDIDRSILGSHPARYRIYAKSIQLEYARDSGRWRYFFGRGRFLRSLLRQPRLLLTDEFEARLGRQARENLQNEWRSLPFLVRFLAR